MTVVIMSASLAFMVIISLIRKYFSIKFQESSYERHVFNIFCNFTGMLFLLVGGGIGKISFPTFCLGAAFGISFAIHTVSFLKAIELGSMSYTNIIVTLSTLIPSLSGAIAFGEKMYPIQYIGMVFMCICFVLSVKTDGEKAKATMRWFLYCMIAMLSNGFTGVTQKWHQNTAYGQEVNGFLFVSCIMAVLYSLVLIIRLLKKEKNLEIKQDNSEIWKIGWILLMILNGITNIMTDKLNMILIGRLDSAVFFPVYNGLSLCLIILSALIIFKERPTVRQWIGMIIGLIAMILLCNPG